MPNFLDSIILITLDVLGRVAKAPPAAPPPEPVDMDATSLRGRTISTDVPETDSLYVYDGMTWIPRQPSQLTYGEELLLGGVPSMEGDTKGIALAYNHGIWIYDEDLGLNELFDCDFSNSTGNVVRQGNGVVSWRYRSASRAGGGAHRFYSGSATIQRAALDDEAFEVLPPTLFGAIDDPVASAHVEIRSTTRGFLPPRLTTAERDAIASPAAGLVIWNTSTTALNVYSGAVWLEVTAA